MLNKTQLLPRAVASKNDSRPAIAGLLVTPKKTCATNQYVLAEIVTIEGTGAKPDDFPTIPSMAKASALPDPFVMPAKVADKIAKSIPKSAALPILENAAYLGTESGTTTFITTDLDTATPISFRPVDDKFPAYESIMPTTEPVSKIRVNASYLLDAAKMLKEFNKLEGNVGLNEITIEIRDGKEPLVLKAESSRHKATILIMPIKD